MGDRALTQTLGQWTDIFASTSQCRPLARAWWNSAEVAIWEFTLKRDSLALRADMRLSDKA